MTVEIRGERGVVIVEATLIDVSIAGIALVVEAGAQLPFQVTDTVALAIHLPRSRLPLEVSGAIRHREEVDDCARLGVAFVGEPRELLATQQEILGYVLARKRNDFDD